MAKKTTIKIKTRNVLRFYTLKFHNPEKNLQKPTYILDPTDINKTATKHTYGYRHGGFFTVWPDYPPENIVKALPRTNGDYFYKRPAFTKHPILCPFCGMAWTDKNGRRTGRLSMVIETDPIFLHKNDIASYRCGHKPATETLIPFCGNLLAPLGSNNEYNHTGLRKLKDMVGKIHGADRCRLRDDTQKWHYTPYDYGKGNINFKQMLLWESCGLVNAKREANVYDYQVRFYSNDFVSSLRLSAEAGRASRIAAGLPSMPNQPLRDIKARIIRLKDGLGYSSDTSSIAAYFDNQSDYDKNNIFIQDYKIQTVLTRMS